MFKRKTMAGSKWRTALLWASETMKFPGLRIQAYPVWNITTMRWGQRPPGSSWRGSSVGKAPEACGISDIPSSKEADIDKKAISRVASIDLKAREQGILEWCRESGIPFAVYPAEVLNDVEGSFTSSAFVKETTGVDNVCERSALLASDGGKLIQRKTAVDGVTAALAVREWRIHFV